MKQFLANILKSKASRKERKTPELKYKVRERIAILYRPGGY